MFSKLSKEQKLNKALSPFWAPVTLNPDQETSDDIIERHTKFLSLPEIKQDILLSSKTSDSIRAISNSLNLGLLQIASIARAVRNYYFGDLPLEIFPETFSREMKIDLETAKKITRQIKEKIIDDTSIKKVHQDKFDKISIRKALEKYPKTKNQMIGTEKILVKNNPQLANPTIENWIRDYVFSMGQEKHTAIERGRYLFQNKNTLRLNASEKESLSLLLKSFDENLPLILDKNTQAIIFDKVVTSTKSLTPTKNREEFTFHQKMPFEEKNKIESMPENKNLPILKIKSSTIDIPSQRKIATNSTREEKRNQKNLIDLKDFN